MSAVCLRNRAHNTKDRPALSEHDGLVSNSNIYSSCSILLLATSNHLLLRVGACLHGFAFLEMQRDIDTYLERVSQLAERELRARSLALHGKGVVFGVGKVAYPKINVHWSEVGIGMCA